MQLTPQQLSVISVNSARCAESFDPVMILDTNEVRNAFGYHDIEFALAAGSTATFHGTGVHDFEKLKTFLQEHKTGYLFGFFTYDLKNQLEDLHSGHPDRIGFPSMYFFVPERLLVVDAVGNVIVGEAFAEELLGYGDVPDHATAMQSVVMNAMVSRENYIDRVNRIREHIRNGDVYELNYCVEFFAKNARVDPFELYGKLRKRSPAPFSAFVKVGNTYLMSASPERFLKHKDNRLISQPIKGTVARGNNEEADAVLKKQLLDSEKERAENLMIVDLVRNDLARSAVTGSVQVEELFGIYPFRQVHQMISTVSAERHPQCDPVDAIRNAFPMGSMTGAPKIKAMELIEQYEESKRGLYSGAVGYFAPSGDFDFNVVIRSIQYNASKQTLSFEVGSAITYDSVPEEEYRECLLKAEALFRVLKGD